MKLNEKKVQYITTISLSECIVNMHQQTPPSVFIPTLAKYPTVHPVEIPQFHFWNFDVISKLLLLITRDLTTHEATTEFGYRAMMLPCAGSLVICNNFLLAQ
jgi:hypothetical protein